MTEQTPTFRVRLRVRIGKPLTTDADHLSVEVDGREVTVRCQDKTKPLKGETWLAFGARGFQTPEAAQAFGERLRDILEIACLSARLGTDVGQGHATSAMNEDWARSIGLLQPNERLAPNIHGILVIPDDETTKIPLLNMKGTVSADPQQLLAAVGELGSAPPAPFASAATGLRIMNLALMSPEPLTQLVLAFSAVEEMGQSESWTSAQTSLLGRVADEVDARFGQDSLTAAERAEVSIAIRRGSHRIGLRQGVVRVLRHHGLGSLVAEWDRLYELRSGVIHGTSRLSEHEVAELAVSAITLCGKVILTVIQRQGTAAPQVASLHFGTI